MEAITEKHTLRPPIEVIVIDDSERQVEFEYAPEAKVDIPTVLLVLPIRLALTDRADRQVKVQISDLAPLTEWTKRFQQ